MLAFMFFALLYALVQSRDVLVCYSRWCKLSRIEPVDGVWDGCGCGGQCTIFWYNAGVIEREEIVGMCVGMDSRCA